MRNQQPYLTLAMALLLMLAAVLGCGKLKDKPDWTRVHKIAGKEQRLSHVSGLVVDDKFAYVTIGGNIADQNEGNSGLRKVSLDSGAVTTLDDGKQLPQSDYGGIAMDDKYVYWNTGGNILRVAKDGGKPEVVASESVGSGLDMVVDNEKIYWANHGYYSAKSPTFKPIYSVAKQGGKTEVFAAEQKIPHSLVADESFVYWLTSSGISKQAKKGGQPQVIYQVGEQEGFDKLSQDNESLYFGFRSAGNSRWALCKISKQGGAPQTLVKTYSLKPVIVDEKNIYFFDEETLMKDTFCRIAKTGGEVTRIDTGYESGMIDQSKTQVYFAGLDEIYSYPK